MLFHKKEFYNAIAYSYAKFGYVLLSIGFLIGYPWAVEAWKGVSWWWDPKISGSLMMWMLYTAYLHAHLHSGKKLWNLTAILGIICFLSLVFTYLLTYISAGVHAYG
jgi:ABC-type transport system involved in cytochrome c biogenesis permease subunit